MNDYAKAAEAIAKVLPVEKVYDDLLHGPMSEVGKAATDAFRVLRLLTAPFQYIATWQPRFERYCKRIEERVPAEKLIEPSPRIVGPVLEALRFADEQDLATELMLELLAAAMHADRVGAAHPAFPGIVVQLSADEALILYHLKKGGYEGQSRQLYEGDPKLRKLGPVEWTKQTFDRAELAQPHHFDVSVSHLGTLGLVESGEEHSALGGPLREVIGTYTRKEVRLTSFGLMFAIACVPDELPTGASREHDR